jgi:hypothetical protein
MEQPTLFEPPQEQLRTEMVARAAKKGLRPATPWEVEHLDGRELFKSNLGGPCFVRIEDHGPGEPDDPVSPLSGS